MKHFTSVKDVQDIDALVAQALLYKQQPALHSDLGRGKRIGLLFMNPSMRTRISTQVAARNLGMDTIVFNLDKEGWQLELDDDIVMNGTSVEHIRDAARVLGSYFDILCVRTFPQLLDRDADYSEVLLSKLIAHSGIPVVSLESATLHPLQSLADVITISEHWQEKRKPKVVLSWAPHIKPLPHCVANSFSEWINEWGHGEFVITHPKGYELDEKYTHGASITYDQEAALQEADFVYVKNWSSYHNYGKVLSDGDGWMLTQNRLSVTNNAKIMHCLPVRRNLELSAEVLDGANSIVTQQAANRVWAAQAVLSQILNHQ
jgi:N-succinyl-L-ornithine transcarbamylase